jgi:hypothetical protein
MKIREFAILVATIALICIAGARVCAGSPNDINTFDTPAAPTLTVTTSVATITASWTTVAGATGYTLYYAPYPFTGLDSVESVDMGNNTSISATLWPGAAFFVAIKAHNSASSSDYSNIELFILPGKGP